MALGELYHTVEKLSASGFLGERDLPHIFPGRSSVRGDRDRPRRALPGEFGPTLSSLHGATVHSPGYSAQRIHFRAAAGLPTSAASGSSAGSSEGADSGPNSSYKSSSSFPTGGGSSGNKG